MAFNLTEVQVKSLSGVPVKGVKLHELVGDVIYNKTSSISWDRIARDIYDGKDVDLTKDQLDYLRDIITSDSLDLVVAVKVAVRDYIDTFTEQK